VVAVRLRSDSSGPGELRPAGYPAELERDVVTLAGEVVRVRPIRPGDAPALVAFHAGLSARTVYLRFFGVHPLLADREVERFTHVDYRDRLALVVETGCRLVAVGRYDRVTGTDEAEVAFVVDDAYQHQGLGTLLADELAAAGWARGIRALVADTLADNAGMIEVFHGLGLPTTSSFDSGVVRMRLPIEPVPSYAEVLARREATRHVQPPGPADPGAVAC
jgi:GNAT superfamily N-acetyltransferase